MGKPVGVVAATPCLLSSRTSSAPTVRVKVACPAVEDATQIIDAPTQRVAPEMALDAAVQVGETALLLL